MIQENIDKSLGGWLIHANTNRKMLCIEYHVNKGKTRNKSMKGRFERGKGMKGRTKRCEGKGIYDQESISNKSLSKRRC